MYTVDYFIKKFEAIPEDNFATGTFMQWHDNNSRCTLGHCLSKRMIRIANDYMINMGVDSFPPEKCAEYSKELEVAYALCLLFNGKSPRNGSEQVIEINNGTHHMYKQPTPKQRILAALHDIKAMQEKEQKPERIKRVYVSIPETIKEQSSELILS